MGIALMIADNKYEKQHLKAEADLQRQTTAKDIFDKIRENKIYRDISGRRWPWELLQNARDVAQDSVKIEISLNEKSVSFSHNGKPFSISNITALIKRISNKDRENTASSKKSYGKFGTGFITTHLLSKKVSVESVFHDPEENIYKKFHLLLDRSAPTIEEMIKSVEKSQEIFRDLGDDSICPRLNNYIPNQNCDTSFNYEIDEKGLSIAKSGIQALHSSLVFTLAFVPEIRSIKIRDEIRSKVCIYESIINHELSEEIKLVSIDKTTHDPKEEKFQRERIVVAHLTDSFSFYNKINEIDETINVDIALKLEEAGNQQYCIKKMESQAPVLFCGFPIVSSETKFSFPFAVNSPDFEPSTDQRTDIALDDENDTGGAKNRAIFERITTLSEKLINYATHNNWHNTHLLVKTKASKECETDWYKNTIQKPLRELALKSPVVITNDTDKTSRINLSDTIIPNVSKINLLEFSEILEILHPGKQPIKVHLEDWQEIISDNDWPSEIKFDLNRLLLEISACENLSSLLEKLNQTEEFSLSWLNKVIAFLNKVGCSNLIDDKFAIIPNQYGEFKLRKNLAKDKGIPDGLKEVIRLLDVNEDKRQLLAHTEIHCDLSNELGLEDISEKINSIITVAVKANKTKNIWKGVFLLLSCLPNEPEVEANIGRTFLKKRKLTWKLASSLYNEFASSLFDSVPTQKSLDSWGDLLWESCDDLILRTMISTIENLKTLSNLKEKLKVETDDEAVAWLSDFISFLNENDKKSMYIDKEIFPNQVGCFSKATQLFLDSSIPEELKDVLEDFGDPIRQKLLNKMILDCQEQLEVYTIQKISEKVSEIIKPEIIKLKNYNQKSLNSNDQDEEIDQDTGFKKAIYKLISYFDQGEE